jgi:hypothetical protein
MGDLCSKGQSTTEFTLNNNQGNNNHNNIESDLEAKDIFDYFQPNLPNFPSKYDIIYSEIEQTYNILKSIDLFEFHHLLNSFNPKGESGIIKAKDIANQPKSIYSANINPNADNSNRPKLDKLLHESFTEETFHNFLNDKILSNQMVLINKYSDYDQKTFFKFMTSIYKSIYKCLVYLNENRNNLNNLRNTDLTNANTIDNERRGSKLSMLNDNTNRDGITNTNININTNTNNNTTTISALHIPKLFIAALGYVYCGASPKGKVAYLFTLFSDDKNKLTFNQILFDFIFVVFSLVSFSGVNTVKEVSETDQNLTRLRDYTYYNICAIYDHVKVFKVTKKFLNDFFNASSIVENNEEGENSTLIGKEKYCGRMGKNEFNWILCNVGIRYKLEHYERSEKVY